MANTRQKLIHWSLFDVISRIHKATFSISVYNKWISFILKNSSNCCRHKYNPTISRIFYSNFWRVFCHLVQQTINFNLSFYKTTKTFNNAMPTCLARAEREVLKIVMIIKYPECNFKCTNHKSQDNSYFLSLNSYFLHFYKAKLFY